MELVLAGMRRAAHGVPRRAGRDRRGRRSCSGSRVRSASSLAGLPAGGVGLPRARDRVGRARLRRASARSRASSRPPRRVALELGGAVVGVFVAARVVADTASGARLAALGDAARLGGGTAPLRRARSPLVLLAPARRERRCCSRSPRGSPRAATSAPACSLRATAPSRGCGCSPRRPRRRCAASAPA